MRSQLAERLGVVEPQILHPPPDVHSLDAAAEAIELADAYGLADGFPLDESQKSTIRSAMGERADGSWAAATVADFEPRQNGKNDAIAAREFWGLIAGGERLQIHTAHEFPTANESFLRLVAVFENYDDLRRKVARIRYANGEQGIELLTGQRLKYKARTGGSGRGFAKADLVVYDEAQHLQAEHVAASGPTRLANPNSQAWYAGSGGLSTSKLAWSLRKRALRGEGGRLSYQEHTAEVVSFDERGRIVSVRPADLLDAEALALANPAFGRRNAMETYEALYAEMGFDLFARECLCIWEPLLEDAEREPPKLPPDRWADTLAPDRDPVPGEVTLAFDVSLDGEWSSIVVGMGDITAPFVDVVQHRQHVGWLPTRLVELVEKWKPIAVGCNGAGPAGAQVGPILSAFREAGISADLLHQLTAPAYKQACGGFFTDVVEGRLKRPAGQQPLDLAGEDATDRPLGDAWAWDVRQSSVPISPLVAATIARALLPTEPEAAPLPTYCY
jgi:hypothetical protein